MNGSQDVVIGKIYANWCGHCQRMGTGFKDNIDEVIKSSGGAPKITAVEIEENAKDKKITELNRDYFGGASKVVYKGYPTVFIISRGKVDYYNGPTDFTDPKKGKRNCAIFKKWIKKHIRAPQRGGGCGCGGFSQRGGWTWRKKSTVKRSTKPSKQSNRTRKSVLKIQTK